MTLPQPVALPGSAGPTREEAIAPRCHALRRGRRLKAGFPGRDDVAAKTAMTSVDVASLAAELAPTVVGARVERVFQPARDRILLRLRRKGTGRIDLLFELGRFITATRNAPANPDKPSMLAQTLRIALENSRVTGFNQMGFDRLVRMDVERGDGKRALVFELFGDGNLLLLDDAGIIVLPMRGEEFTARRLKKGEPYVPPPAGPVPFSHDQAALAAAGAEAKKDVIRFLAGELGFGPLWAEELLLRARVEKGTKASEVSAAQWHAIHEAIRLLGAQLKGGLLTPALVHEVVPREAPKLVDAVPFVMESYPPPRFAHEEAATFNEALDGFFLGTSPGEGGALDAEADDPRRSPFDAEAGRLNRQISQVREAAQKFLAEETERRADGEAMYAAFPQAESLLQSLTDARRGHGWAEVEAVLEKHRAEGHALARQVPEVRAHDGTAILRLRLPDGRERPVEVDLQKSVQENADVHFAAAKKARAKRESAQAVQREAEAALAALEKKGLAAFGAAPVRVERVSRHFWFESYRWTITPSGLIAVGGRNAAQNDAVVKKYLRDGDRYVHAQIHGAPSVVVRPAEGAVADIATDDLRAACHFAAVMSRAWRLLGPATAYWVTAQQVSKTPATGEYVPRGAWMIHGKRNVEPDLPMEWWVAKIRFRPDGVPMPRGADAPKSYEKFVGATRAALAPYAVRARRITPGTEEPNDGAARLAEIYGITMEEAQAVMPPGPVAIGDEVQL
jgi:predicted ribosome quality control (RQC) complex YloA/Tae2 family protein